KEWLEPGYPDSEKHESSGSETCHLDDLEGIKAWRGVVAMEQSTQHEDAGQQACYPPEHVSTWNKLLWGAQLELRCTVRGLLLVSLSQTFLRQTEQQVRRATTLVVKLLFGASLFDRT
ncbi:hypothetical protein MRX96_050061, partial [Rhipicephalus microplus]